jgi:hypothetical protein
MLGEGGEPVGVSAIDGAFASESGASASDDGASASEGGPALMDGASDGVAEESPDGAAEGVSPESDLGGAADGVFATDGAGALPDVDGATLEAGDGDLLGVAEGAVEGVEFDLELPMPGGITIELICNTDTLNGCETTALTNLAPKEEPGTADPKATSPPLKSVTFKKPCWPVAWPLAWKRVVRRLVLLDIFWSFGTS